MSKLHGILSRMNSSHSNKQMVSFADIMLDAPIDESEEAGSGSKLRRQKSKQSLSSRNVTLVPAADGSSRSINSHSKAGSQQQMSIDRSNTNESMTNEFIEFLERNIQKKAKSRPALNRMLSRYTVEEFDPLNPAQQSHDLSRAMEQVGLQTESESVSGQITPKNTYGQKGFASNNSHNSMQLNSNYNNNNNSASKTQITSESRVNTVNSRCGSSASASRKKLYKESIASKVKSRILTEHGLSEEQRKVKLDNLNHTLLVDKVNESFATTRKIKPNQLKVATKEQKFEQSLAIFKNVDTFIDTKQFMQRIQAKNTTASAKKKIARAVNKISMLGAFMRKKDSIKASIASAAAESAAQAASASLRKGSIISQNQMDQFEYMENLLMRTKKYINAHRKKGYTDMNEEQRMQVLMEGIEHQMNSVKDSIPVSDDQETDAFYNTLQKQIASGFFFREIVGGFNSESSHGSVALHNSGGSTMKRGITLEGIMEDSVLDDDFDEIMDQCKQSKIKNTLEITEKRMKDEQIKKFRSQAAQLTRILLATSKSILKKNIEDTNNAIRQARSIRLQQQVQQQLNIKQLKRRIEIASRSNYGDSFRETINEIDVEDEHNKLFNSKNQLNSTNSPHLSSNSGSPALQAQSKSPFRLEEEEEEIEEEKEERAELLKKLIEEDNKQRNSVLMLKHQTTIEHLNELQDSIQRLRKQSGSSPISNEVKRIQLAYEQNQPSYRYSLQHSRRSSDATSNLNTTAATGSAGIAKKSPRSPTHSISSFSQRVNNSHSVSVDQFQGTRGNNSSPVVLPQLNGNTRNKADSFQVQVQLSTPRDNGSNSPMSNGDLKRMKYSNFSRRNTKELAAMYFTQQEQQKQYENMKSKAILMVDYVKEPSHSHKSSRQNSAVARENQRSTTTNKTVVGNSNNQNRSLQMPTSQFVKSSPRVLVANGNSNAAGGVAQKGRSVFMTGVPENNNRNDNFEQSPISLIGGGTANANVNRRISGNYSALQLNNSMKKKNSIVGAMANSLGEAKLQNSKKFEEVMGDLSCFETQHMMDKKGIAKSISMLAMESIKQSQWLPDEQPLQSLRICFEPHVFHQGNVNSGSASSMGTSNSKKSGNIHRFIS